MKHPVGTSKPVIEDKEEPIGDGGNVTENREGL